MRRNVLLALVALLALSAVGCGDVHVYEHRRPHYRHRMHAPPPRRVVHVHTTPPPPPRVVHVHTRPAPTPRVVIHKYDRRPGRKFDGHPGRGHGHGHGHARGHSDAELRLKARGENGRVDLRVKVDD